MKFFKRLFLILILIILIIGSIMLLNGYKLYKTVTNEISLSNKIAEVKNMGVKGTYFHILNQNLLS